MSKKEQLIELIKDMSPEEIAGLLIGQDEPKTKKKRKQSRGKKTPPVGRLHEEDEAEERDGDSKGSRPKGRKAGGRAKRIARKGERTSKRKRNPGGRESKTWARSETVDTSGDRELNTDPWIAQQLNRAHKTKKEVQEEQELQKDWTPRVPRPSAQFVEAECLECGDLWEVPSTRVYEDEDGLVFRCDDCLKRGKEKG